MIAISLGIVIVIIAASKGAKWHNDATYSCAESYQDIKAIDIKINVGEVFIKEGDEFHVEGDNLLKNGFESYIEDGTWIIKEQSDKNSDIEIFGFNISPENFSFGYDNSPKLTVTVPKDFVSKEFNLDLGAGVIQAEAIRTVDGKFTVGAGALKIDDLIVTGKSEYSVGAGEMEMNQIEASNIELSCGIGNVNMTGTITGNSKVSCGIGNIEMNLEGNAEDYSYQVDCGIGSVKINEESYHGIVKQSINSNANDGFSLDCGIGKISLKIN